MIVRTVDGKIQMVNRSNFKNDLLYHNYIYKLLQPFCVKYSKTVRLNIKSKST